MGQVRKVIVAGTNCLTVSTQADDGWRAAGYCERRTVVVESLPTEDEAFMAWKLKALDSLLLPDPPQAILAG